MGTDANIKGGDILVIKAGTRERIVDESGERDEEHDADEEREDRGPVAAAVALQVFQSQLSLDAEEPAGQPGCLNGFPPLIPISLLSRIASMGEVAAALLAGR